METYKYLEVDGRYGRGIIILEPDPIEVVPNEDHLRPGEEIVGEGEFVAGTNFPFQFDTPYREEV